MDKMFRVIKWIDILVPIVYVCLLIICWVNKFISTEPMWESVWFVLGMMLFLKLIEGVTNE